MIAEDGKTVKVTDFGLASVLKKGTDGQLHASNAPGTDEYRSPEHIDSTKKITAKSDVYSWALTVLSMYLGNTDGTYCPWGYGVILALVEKKREEYLRYPRGRVEIPESIRTLLRQCMQEDPATRPDFAEIMRQIDGFTRGDTKGTVPRRDIDISDNNKTRQDSWNKTSVYGNSVGNIVNLGIVSMQGDWIYGRNNTGTLYKIRTDGTDLRKLSDDSCFYINVVGDWVYYSNGNDYNKLYKIRTDGTGEQKLSDDDCEFINVVGDWVYYSNRGDNDKIYKIRTDGTGRRKINDDDSMFINVVGDWIYYTNLSDDIKLYKIRTDGTGRQKLSDDAIRYINVVGDWVYYGNLSDNGKLYKIRTDGTKRQKLNDDESRAVNIIGEWAHYSNKSDGGKLYKIRADGTGKQPVM